MNPIRVLIVDDHPLVREGLRSLFGASVDIRVAGEASDGLEAIAAVREAEFDVVLMDLQLPKLDGMESTRRIKAIAPEVKIIVLTSHLSPGAVKEALKAGAIGYLLKDISRSELESAVRAATVGQFYFHKDAESQLVSSVILGDPASPVETLTTRERDVFRLLALGRSNKEIAKELDLTEGTVKGYVSSIFVKTGTEDRTQAALLGARLGIAD